MMVILNQRVKVFDMVGSKMKIFLVPIIILLLMFSNGCSTEKKIVSSVLSASGTNPTPTQVETKPASDQPKEKEVEIDVPTDQTIIPGLTINGIETGGIRRKNVMTKMRIKTPIIYLQDEKSVKDEYFGMIGTIATYCAAIGFVTLVLAAILFYFKQPCWVDLFAIGFIMFAAGTATCIWLNIFIWIVGIAAIAFGIYVAYNMYFRHKTRKVQDELVDSVDIVKHLPTWDEKAKEYLNNIQDKVTKDVIKESKERRTKLTEKVKKIGRHGIASLKEKIIDEFKPKKKQP